MGKLIGLQRALAKVDNFGSLLCKRMMLACAEGSDSAEYLRGRFPRLIDHMRWQGLLSRYEASYALRDYVYGRDRVLDPILMRSGGGEAVCHYGGPLKVIRDAIARRHFHPAPVPRG